jgi:hypothetical protein
MAEHQVLFCPFCRESFEAAPHASLCPEHELPLVSFDQLAANSEQTDGEDLDDEAELDGLSPGLSPEDRPLGAYDPGLGRAVVGLGALLNAAALGLSPVHLPGAASPSLYQLARTVPSLWTLGLVSFTVLFALARRRTPRSLRGLRVLVPTLGLLSPITVGFTLARLGALGAGSPGHAVYAVALAALLLVAGGLRLGGPLLASGRHDRDRARD